LTTQVIAAAGFAVVAVTGMVVREDIEERFLLSGD